MKHAIWFLPVALVTLAVIVISEGLSLLTVSVIGLLCVGAVFSFRIGSRWEFRWNELIRERERNG